MKYFANKQTANRIILDNNALPKSVSGESLSSGSLSDTKTSYFSSAFVKLTESWLLLCCLRLLHFGSHLEFSRLHKSVVCGCQLGYYCKYDLFFWTHTDVSKNMTAPLSPSAASCVKFWTRFDLDSQHVGGMQGSVDVCFAARQVLSLNNKLPGFFVGNLEAIGTLVADRSPHAPTLKLPW